MRKMIGLCLLLLVAVSGVQAQRFEDMVKRFMRVTDKRSYVLITVDLKDCQCSQMKGALTEELLQLMAAQEAKASKE